MPWVILLRIVAQAVGAAAGKHLAERLGDILEKATKGDDYKRVDVAAALVRRVANGCPERIQKIAELAKQEKND